MNDATSRLYDLRQQIDDINLKLLDLLNQRAEIVSEIGHVKGRMEESLYDPEREAEMLETLQKANEGPFSNDTISTLFKQIFSASLAMIEKEARSLLLVQRKSPDQRTVIELRPDVRIGDGSFQVIAGSCAVESFEQTDTVAAALAQQGVRLMRGMAYKPRSSPYSFQGLGEEGLKIARRVANKHGLLLTSEVIDASQIPMMADYVDVFWVGARNMQNSFLLRALGNVPQPVILKRSFGATLEEFLYAAEYIVSRGNPNVILIERGIRTFERWTRNTLDISAVPLLKQESHLPVVVDISHSAGRRDIADTLAKVVKASGADGLMVEVHPNPPVALSDAKQQLSIPEFERMMAALATIPEQPTVES